jgi:phosphate/sulfate permease
MKNELEQLERLDTDGATFVSLWFGAGGFFVGVIGIGLTIYTLNAKEPSILWLTLSGWIAALLTAFALGYIGYRLIKLVGNQSRRLQNVTKEMQRLRDENTRLIEIDAYIVAKGMRSSGSRAVAQRKEESAKEFKTTDTDN